MGAWVIGQGVRSANFRRKDSRTPKPVAHYAISDSSGDDCPGIHFGAGKEKHVVANMALSSTTPRLGGLVARMDEDEALKPLLVCIVGRLIGPFYMEWTTTRLG